jgi:hypothetical protein
MTSLKNLVWFNRFLSVPFALTFLAAAVQGADGKNPCVGRWALTVPGGGPGWLGITAEKGYYDGSILWVAGSVEPLDSVFFNNDTLHVTRIHDVQRKDDAGKVVRTQRFTDLITGRVDGDDMTLTIFRTRADGEGMDREEFSGKRIPTVPPAPDLAKVKYGEAIPLFNGKSLEGWRLTDPKQVSGWSVAGDILVNNPAQQEGKPHVSYGNLRTEREFEDFNLKLETRVPKNGNSGVYLRGIYEVQVADTYGKPLDPHNMGAIYSRITPSEAAEKPPGEWQTMDITLCDRHATVVLNGKKIIDNKPLLGCTGGALWSDEMKPGPIYLQGDHAAVEYRNIVLKPIMK